ncbi:hypothetical protein HKBW3S25_01672 [Candidatus Hakubella thermalkaliphila]|uniref:Polysaccharide chain length determinant N-terminal domain-containing protein n=1 Tax=Candidatus Hakubella thermalkaliphila TaxID=2754717 RepID=A0A6V8P0Z3_9ACTN|nr:hypothetical protein HKBW3S25_01672 [Candidatus Hakubella thermalkaliphila]
MEQKKEPSDDEINLLDYLIVLAKRKRLIIGITLSAAIITAIISLIMPPIYKAETKILPPATGQLKRGTAFKPVWWCCRAGAGWRRHRHKDPK